MEAARVRSYHLIELLLRYGADSNHGTDRGHRALMEAGARGYETIAQRLLDHGACVDDSNAEGVTALHLACAGGFTAVFNTLINAGADPNRADHRGITSLMRAVMHRDMVSRLLSVGADLRAISRDGDSAILRAAQNRDLHMVVYLLEAGADEMMKRTHGRRVVEAARAGGSAEVIRLLAPYHSQVS
tara:strand:- start:32 stop:592 length:561 start_codon:yes stop_codon:yes gene_type:complete